MTGIDKISSLKKVKKFLFLLATLSLTARPIQHLLALIRLRRSSLQRHTRSNFQRARCSMTYSTSTNSNSTSGTQSVFQVIPYPWLHQLSITRSNMKLRRYWIEGTLEQRRSRRSNTSSSGLDTRNRPGSQKRT